MEIHWFHVEEIDDAERAAAEQRLRTLSEGHSDLIDLRIAGKSTGHHRLGAREVRITCQARGRDIVAVRTRPEISLALHDALEAFENEVRKLRHRRRDRRGGGAASPPLLGIIDRVFPDEGYGFILTDGGERVYFHRNAVHGGLDFDALDEGQRVGLNLEGGEKGPQATTVVAPPPDTPGP
jgi:cold shock CspA family protein/ribosome-associated translation inhibitor RaiA